MAQQFYGSLALSKLKHVLMEKKGKSGMVKGIFIPIEANGLVEGKEGAVYANINGTIHDEPDKFDNDGFIAFRYNNGKKWSEMTDEEKELSKDLSPILGNFKLQGGGGYNDNNGAATSGTVGKNDTLPF